MFASQGTPPVSITRMGNFPPLSTAPMAYLPPVSMTPAVKFTEVGGPQISFANCNKFADLQKFYIYGPSASVAIWGFAICDLLFVDPIFFAISGLAIC
jgi:hypothetical protein